MLAAIGSHWAILQSVAWTQMLASNLKSDSFGEALVKTFDGKHPCCLCKRISTEKKSEKKSDFNLDLKKLEFSYTPVVFIFTAPEYFWNIRAAEPIPFSLTRAPLTPPPRVA
ncbi:MAG TPA: hypothetical protein VFM25_10770 [Verrucomicrobiae bacterium]|nr:hypothetical protein [Verrucomicrobiae bacterium]